MADDGANAHVAVVVCEGNVPGGVGVEAGRQGVGTGGCRGRVGFGVNSAGAADEVDAFP